MRRVVLSWCACSLLGIPSITGCTSQKEIKAAMAETQRYRAAAMKPSAVFAAPETRPETVATANPPTAKAAVDSQLPQRMVIGKTSDVRVMSFNLRVPIILDGLNYWELRKGALSQTIRKFDPDILGTQECVEHQAEYLRGQMPDYEFVGVGREDGVLKGEMCGVFFKRDRFKAVDHGHFWLSKNPAEAGSKSWGAWYPRMVTWVKLQPRDGGQVFYHFNTHFEAWGARARVESAKLLRDQIAVISKGLPVVVTGDFNADAGSTPYKELLAYRSFGDVLRDTFLVANPGKPKNDGTHHDFHGKTSGDRIDWILASSDFATLQATIDHTKLGGRYPSDHFPVAAILRPVTHSTLAQIE